MLNDIEILCFEERIRFMKKKKTGKLDLTRVHDQTKYLEKGCLSLGCK